MWMYTPSVTHTMSSIGYYTIQLTELCVILYEMYMTNVRLLVQLDPGAKLFHALISCIRFLAHMPT